mmetsp:Transcript_33914/g.75216  ORF Transcript_33914/g.75216 Transcript_33914/m.75216 type:complete len:81 (-) Transcript_33914:1148-1390(-)
MGTYAVAARAATAHCPQTVTTSFIAAFLQSPSMPFTATACAERFSTRPFEGLRPPSNVTPDMVCNHVGPIHIPIRSLRAR